MRETHRYRNGILLSSFLLVFVTLTLLLPLIINIIYSLSNVTFSNLMKPELVGFRHYVALFRDDSFFSAIKFSFRFALVCTVAEIFLGIFFVLIFDSISRKTPYINAFLILPMMISPALLGLTYALSFNEFVGIIPHFLGKLGINYDFLSGEHISSTLFLIEILQWTPFAYLIFLSAWQGFPEEILEAAYIDGTSWKERFFFIRMPILLPSLLTIAFIRFIDSFRAFDNIYVLTRGGPGNSTTTLSIYIYKNFFTLENLGLSLAASMVLLVATIFLLFILMRKIVRD